MALGHPVRILLRFISLYYTYTLRDADGVYTCIAVRPARPAELADTSPNTHSQPRMLWSHSIRASTGLENGGVKEIMEIYAEQR